MLVDFEYANGRNRRMPRETAKLLESLKRGKIQTRAIAPVDELTILRKQAADRGIYVHHRAGVDKIRAALKEADECESSG